MAALPKKAPGCGGGNDGDGDDHHHLHYHRGYGNHFESEAYAGALPRDRNNPRIVPHGLYTEKLSGTAFTAPRNENRQTWLYRFQPSVAGTSNSFHACGGCRSGGGDCVDGADKSSSVTASSSQLRRGVAVGDTLPKIFGHADWSKDMKLDPNPMRWGPMPLPTTAAALTLTAVIGGESSKINFIQGINTLLGSGDPTVKSGLGIYGYAFNSNMLTTIMMSGEGDDYSESENDDDISTRKTINATEDIHMYNSDGDLLIVPQQRSLWIQTELGRMTAMPGEICIIPRGVVFAVNILNHGDGVEEESNGLFARGYILEIFRGHFQLPELGPIGSNGLANARDFLHPSAHYESNKSVAKRPCTIVNKFGQHLFARANPYSPYNVVAWHGNYLPCKYDLRKFCAINSVTYDHPDPSIYTVLTAKGGDEEGTALADFVIFPPRIMATGMLYQLFPPIIVVRCSIVSDRLTHLLILFRREYLSASMVSSKCHDRVYGFNLWRV